MTHSLSGYKDVDWEWSLGENPGFSTSSHLGMQV